MYTNGPDSKDLTNKDLYSNNIDSTYLYIIYLDLEDLDSEEEKCWGQGKVISILDLSRSVIASVGP